MTTFRHDPADALDPHVLMFPGALPPSEDPRTPVYLVCIFGVIILLHLTKHLWTLYDIQSVTNPSLLVQRVCEHLQTH